jgi:hypothetical protein
VEGVPAGKYLKPNVKFAPEGYVSLRGSLVFRAPPLGLLIGPFRAGGCNLSSYLFRFYFELVFPFIPST